MRKLVIASLLGSAIGLLAGCPDRTISEVIPEQGRVETKDIPVNFNRNVDILFVIDNSPSMADKQKNLADNFPNFINVLNTIQGGLPDVHIGVVTSDMGTYGSQDAAPGPSIGQIGNGGCSGTGANGNLTTNGAPVTGVFISDIKQVDGSRQTNYTGNLADVFGTMAKVGAGGCGFEQHLEAAKHALNNNPANAGFVRADAFLALIFIADEDDCSLAKVGLLSSTDQSLGPLQSFRCTRFGITCDIGGQTPDQMNQVGTKDQCHSNEASQFLAKVQGFVDFVKGLKSDPKKIIVAGIMGNLEPVQTELRAPPGGGTAIQALAHSCSYIGPTGMPEVADPPVRIKFFLDQFPDRTTFTTVCQTDLSGGLQQIGQLLKVALGDPCINGTLAEPYQCAASYRLPNGTETIIPECDAGITNKPCWHIIADATKCPAGQNLIFKVEDDAAPSDAIQHVDCVTVAPQ
jgi:hypothetical protein